MSAPTSSQRISFTQLVLDMGLADRKALLRAKKLIKERKAEGQKLTIARACVELGVLTEKQAKKVQLELKRIKHGLASSSEFTVGEGEEGAARKKRKKKARPSGEGASGTGDASAEAKPLKKKKAKPSAEAKVEKKAKPSAEAEVEEKADGDAEAEATPPKKKAKGDEADGQAKQDEDAAAEEKAEPDADAAEAEAKPAKKKKAAAKPAKKKAEPEDEAASDEAVTDEEASDEAKVAAPAPAKTAKLGKEIKLSSQKKPVKGKAPVRGPAPKTARRGRAAATSGDEAAPKAPSKTPLIALAGLVVVLLIGGMVVVSRGSDSPTQPGEGNTEVAVVQPSTGGGSPADEPGAVEQPSARPSAGAPQEEAEVSDRLRAERTWERIAIKDKALDKADQGKFKEAVELIESFPEELRDEPVWTETAAPYLEKYKKFVGVQEEFEAALAAAEGGDDAQLREVTAKILHPDYEHFGEYFVDRFRDKAREVLGEETFAKLQQKATAANAADDFASLDEGLDELVDEDSQVAILEKKAPEIETRGTEERREAFRQARQTAEQNLVQARKTLEERRRARREKVEAEARRVIAYTKRSPLDFEGQKAKVTAYDEDGFTVQLGRDERTFGWGNAPAQLGHDVKFRAIDTSSAEDVYQLGVYALKLGRFRDAERHFKKTLELDASYQPRVPDVASFEPFFELFRGKKNIPSEPGERSVVQWDFSDRKHAMDFEGMAQGMNAEVVGGQLKVSQQMPMYRFTMAEARGQWRDGVELTATLASKNPAPVIGISSEGGTYVVEFGQKVVFKPLSTKEQEPLAQSEVRANPGSVVKIKAEVLGEQIKVQVLVDGRDCFTHQMPWEGAVKVILGAMGQGEARFDDMEAAGVLDPKWVKRAQASGPNEVARALAQFESQQGGDQRGGGLPVAYRKTSAEDAVGLADIPQECIAAVEEGRQLLAQGNQMAAAQKFKEAGDRSIEYHAAHYLYAQIWLGRDPDGALFRCERAIKGIEDFYEAWACKAIALLRLGRVDEAKKAAATAIELRPDYAPGHVAKAQIEILEGRYEQALDILELAEVLGPGDPDTAIAVTQARALAEGPSWAKRKRVTTENYVLDTDYVEDADRLAKHLEAIRARYVEAFPVLIDPDAPKRLSNVLIFQEPEGYYQYSFRTSRDRAENTLGHFNPTTGQLLLFLGDADIDERGSLHVVYHEGTHQWVHGNGVSLPYWANEGVAEYVGGTILSDEGEILERAMIDPFLEGRLKNLTEMWDQRMDFFDIMNESPQEFYSGVVGLKYAQAWTMVHFFMESGDETLKKTFIEYLRRFKEAGKNDTSAREGTKLQQIYVDTFYDLDVNDVQQRWEQWVKKLCDKAGVPFPSK